MNELTEKRHIVLEIIYIIIIAASAMGDSKTFDFSYDLTRLFKALTLLAAALGLGALLVTGKLGKAKKCARFVGVYGFVLLGIIIWSIFLWIVNLETVDFILRGTLKFMFQCIVLLIIFAAVYMFGERAIYATFYGLALANTVMIAINLGVYGLPASIESIVTMISTGDQAGFTRALEIHDITFTYGFFVIYFLFFAQHTKERTFCFFLSAFYFLMGWKRIALFALIAALFVGLVLGMMKSKYRIMLMKTIAWLFVLASFAYVLVVRFGVFEYLMNYFEIDSMGRNEIYDYIHDYYNISIGFLGYGFEYTTIILQDAMLNNPEAHIGVLGLHNNILTEYIELGFLGFWAWLIYTWVFQLRWMLSHWGEKVAMLFFLCEMYIFLTYTTDNTLYYFYSSMVLRLMPMAYVFHVKTQQDVRLWPWIRTQQIPTEYKTG